MQKNDQPKIKKPSKQYLDNKEMLDVILAYRAKRKEAQLAGTTLPKIPNYIGQKLIQLSDELAKRLNFSRYSYIDEMKLDAIENCIMYFDNFNPDKISERTGKKCDNPHAYFTTIMWQAFVRRIQKEKKQAIAKHKNLLNMYTFEEMQEYASQVGYSNPYMDEMTENYENSEKKKPGRPKKNKGTVKNETKKRTQFASTD